MSSLPAPDLEPHPITYEVFLGLVPEKFEWVDGYLFAPPYNHWERRRLLTALLTNEGLIQTVQLVPPERWLKALKLAAGLGKKPKRSMTYEEFLAWADEDALAEWVDGEVIMTSTPSRRHQEIAGFLYEVLRRYVQARRLGEVIQAPFQMKLEHGRAPDLIFVAREHLDRLRDTDMEGPADLVVEIVSPESVGRDRGDKFYEYAQGGVLEYWLIDPQTETAEFYRLEEGRYCLAFSGEEGEYRSQVLPGFWLRVEWLWREPLPLVEDVLLEVGGEAYARQWIERLRRQGFLSPS